MSEPRAAALLAVDRLAIRFGGPDGGNAVTDVSFEVRPGETVGVVGESGAGKTMTCLALLQLIPAPGRIVGGSIAWRGSDVAGFPSDRLRRLRGGEIGFAFQDPTAALHPSIAVVDQVAEAIWTQQPASSRRAAREAADALLASLGVSELHRRRLPYPHQWSGGMRQRGLLAIALANDPALLVADEPTTGLDVTTQRQILDLLKGIRAESATAMLISAHDLAVIGEMADRVLVMLAGRVVEIGPTSAVLERPGHPYTQALLGTADATGNGSPRPSRGCVFATRCPIGRDRARCREEAPAWHDVGGDSQHRTLCHYADEIGSLARITARGPVPAVVAASGGPVLEVDRLRVVYRSRRGLLRPAATAVAAVDGVSFELAAGETLGLVGESGCGKSSLARALVRLEEPEDGRVVVNGRTITHARGAELRRARADIQIVFQNPFASLNPRRVVGDCIAHPLVIHGRGDSATREARVAELLGQVGLRSDIATRYPHELSGGERQRVAIARALALDPRVLVLDEPVSSLDGPTRAGILDLLRRLQAELELAYLFITHDLEVVSTIAHRVAVMYLGKIVETGGTAELYRRPLHPYTGALLAAAPDPRARGVARGTALPGEVPDAASPPSGCRFRTRCYRAEERCAIDEPALVKREDRHPAACHFAGEFVGGARTS